MTVCPHCESKLLDASHCGECHQYFVGGLIANLTNIDPDVRKAAADNCVFVTSTQPLIETLGNAADCGSTFRITLYPQRPESDESVVHVDS